MMATRKPATSSPHRLRLVRQGFEFEAEGERDFVIEMARRYAASVPESSEVSVTGSKGQDENSNKIAKATSKALSVREFILRLESKKHTDLVLAFGYYLEKHVGQSAFASVDINNLYYEAKLETSNTSQMIIHNIRRGNMMEAKKSENGGKKQYVLTNTGESYLESLMTASQS